jgi:shikimate kinase
VRWLESAFRTAGVLGVADELEASFMNWQRASIQAAAAYLRERIAAGATDPRTNAVYEGLLEVLDPNRRTARVQRELAQSAKAAVAVHSERDRRAKERRSHVDRRKVNLGSPTGVDRRANADRRGSSDRRHGR